MDFYNETILERHLEGALRSCESVIKKGNKWNFRCNICGDSKKVKRKRRAWILRNRNGIWIFNCFNICGSMGALAWLKKYFPETYRDYIRDILLKTRTKRIDILKVEEKKPEIKIEEPPKPKPKFPFISLKLEKNHELEIAKDAIKFCEARKIGRDIWSTFFVCKEDKYCNRLIIPFYNNENKPYYFIARSLYNNEPKYLGMEGEKKPYNIYNVNKELPVICLEGPLDALFVDNAIALSGLQFNEDTEKYLEGMKIYYLLDSDEAGQDKSLRLLEKGNYVFNWYKFKRDFYLPSRQKWDINEVVLYIGKDSKFTFNELKKYFTNSYLDSIYFERIKKYKRKTDANFRR